MDDKFLDTLKTFSVKDIIADVQRPPTSTTRRLKTAGRRVPGAGGSLEGIEPLKAIPSTSGTTSDSPTGGSGLSMGNSVLESIHRPGTSMVSNRPPSSAFASPSTRTGSWRLDSAAPGTASGRGRPGTTFRPKSTRAAAAAATTFGFSDMDDDLNIPDLDDVAEEEFTQTVAYAPEYEIQRLTSLRELDAELAKNKSFCVVDGIDLRKLARKMVPERKLVELDDVWTYNSLYSELAARFEEGRIRAGDGNQKYQK